MGFGPGALQELINEDVAKLLVLRIVGGRLGSYDLVQESWNINNLGSGWDGSRSCCLRVSDG